MTAHLPILPILLPLIGALLMLLPPISRSLLRQRVASAVVLALTLIATVALLQASAVEARIYVLGDWQPPFGIVLVADLFAVLLVLLTTVLAVGALLAAYSGHDQTGMYFHPLFLFQITGIHGAFLTGDIFNLFVFFEILLIASYALLIHGGGKAKTQAAVHYVVLNLLGSAFFLIALGILYGTLGTLNMADMAHKAPRLGDEERHLAQVGVLLLVLVFGLKAAVLPLHFWLTRTYSAAVAPIAALFAIMTKVGVYSLYRVHVQIFGESAGPLAHVATPWLWALAVVTLIVACVGLLASRRLSELVSWLVIVSVGSLVLSVALHTPEATTAGIYYLIHSTLVTGALFLLCDLIAAQRGQAGDRFVSARPLPQTVLLGGLFLLAAMTVVGLPPFSGFVGKVLLLQAAEQVAEQVWVWPLVLISGLAALIALSRAGTTLFWRVRGNRPTGEGGSRWQLAGVLWLLLASPALVIWGGPVTDLVARAAVPLHPVASPLVASEVPAP